MNMDIETLEKANKYKKWIEDLEENISKAEYTQSENVVIRKAKFSCNGTVFEIPESLFRIIGKLVIAENKIELEKVKEVFNKI